MLDLANIFFNIEVNFYKSSNGQRQISKIILKALI